MSRRPLRFIILAFLICSPIWTSAQIVIQPSPESGKDSYVSSAHPDVNYGTADGLYFAGNPWEKDTMYLYIQFDLTTVPKGTIINSARLDSYMWGLNGSMSAYRYGAYQVVEAWGEATITWNNRPKVSSTAAVTLDGSALEASWNQWYSVKNLADLVQDWVNNPTSNFGLVLKAVNQFYGYPYFYSSDYLQDPSLRPRLVINSQKNSIAGFVLDSQSGQRIQNAVVSAFQSIQYQGQKLFARDTSDATGAFELVLDVPGTYQVKVDGMNGYMPGRVDSVLVVEGRTTSQNILLQYNQNAVGGLTSGRWTKSGSPYVVTADILVADNLTIDPGVQVLFAGRFAFIVKGILTAVGTVQDSIVFSRYAESDECRSKGIRFIGASSLSHLEYCRIEYGKSDDGVWGSSPDDRGGGVYVENSSIVVEKCLIQNNQANEGAGVSVFGGSPVIRGNTIRNNAATFWGYAYCGGGGLRLENTTAIVENNFILKNSYLGQSGNYEGGGGIYVLGGPQNALIRNNLVIANTSDGLGGSVYCAFSSPRFENNTIFGNIGSTAIYTAGSGSNPTFVNCIVWGNSGSVFGSKNGGIVTATYSDIQGGYAGLGSINADPRLTSAESFDFTLLGGSPCVDSGDPTPALNDLCFPPGRGEARNDMGAYGGPGACTNIPIPFRSPSVPALMFPSNGGTFQPTTITLRWRGSIAAARYKLQVARSSSFLVGIAVDDSTIVDTARVVSVLANDTKYYWRVSASNSDGASNYSDTWSFTTGNPISIPSTPVLSYPSNGSGGLPLSPPLGWYSSLAATSYGVQLSTDSTFASALVIDDQTVADTSRAVGGLIGNKRYFWRANAKNSLGTSTYSPRWSFTTGESPAVTTNPATNVGLSSAAISGTFDAKGSATVAYFEWGTNGALTSYNSTASQSIGSGLNAVVVTANLAGLSPGVTYYYRAVGQNSSGTSRGAIVSFTTSSGVPLLGEYAPDANTVLLLHMNEAGGSSVNDASSSRNNGTATATTIVDGKFGKARQCGDQNPMYVPYSSSLDIGDSDFTLEAWIKLSSRSAVSSIISKYSGSSGKGFDFQVTSNTGSGSAYIWVRNSSGAIVGLGGATRVDDARWHHVATRRFKNILSVFVDGKVEDTVDISTFGSFASTYNIDLSRGIGTIDEVRISNKARSPQEFNLQLPPKNLTAVALGTTINLTWQNGGGAVPLMRYKIYRGTDSTNTALIDSTTSLQYSNSGLSPGAKYFYRIGAVDSTGFAGAKSYAVGVVVDQVPVGTPTLSSPFHNATNQSTSLTVQWSRSAGATGYRVQISGDQLFRGALFLDDSTVVDTSKVVDGLVKGIKYWWRVSARNLLGSSSFSAAWSFTIQPVVALPTQTTLFAQCDGPYGAQVRHLALNSSGHIFAATWGGGVYRSTDNGDRWTRVGNPGHFASIFVDDKGIVYTSGSSGGTRGRRSVDNGETWTSLLPDNDIYGFVQNSRGFVFTGAVNYNSTGGGIYRSSDHGQTWSKTLTSGNILTFAATPNGDVLACSDSADLYRSTDNGDSWTKLNSPIHSYIWGASLAASVEGKIYASLGGALFSSTDNGATWARCPINCYSIAITSTGRTYAAGGTLVCQSTDKGNSWISTESQEYSVSSVAVNLEGYAFVGMSAGDGVYRTTDNGATWTQCIQGFTNTSVNSMVVGPRRQFFVGAGNSSLSRTTNNGQTWSRVKTDPSSRFTFSIAFNSHGDLFAAGANPPNGIIYLSTDEGISWSKVKDGIDQVNAITIDTTNDYVYAGVAQTGIYRSTDRGLFWQTKNAGLSDLNVQVLLVLPGNSILLAGTEKGGVFRSTDYGNSWIASTTGIQDRNICSSAIDSSGNVYLGTGEGRIYRSTDRGVSWSGVYSPLSKVYGILITASGAIYASLGFDILRSTDDGATWVQFSSGIPLGYSLLGLDAQSYLYATTYGAGLFRSNYPIVLPRAQLAAPGNSTSGHGSTVTLLWGRVAGAAKYHLQVSSDATFAVGSLVLDIPGVVDTTYKVIELSSRKYYWRVQAWSDVAQSPNSSTFTFRVGAAALQAPALVSPADNTINQPTTLPLRWRRVSGAAAYQLQVARDSSFQSSSLFLDAPVSDTAKAVSGMELGTQYFWHVMATSAIGESNWSSTWKFSTVASPMLGEYVPDTSTVLLLHMNDSGGSTVGDASNFVNHGSAGNGATIRSPGRFGSARAFDGSLSANIAIPASSSLTFGTGDFSAELWLKTTSALPHRLLYRKTAANREWSLNLGLMGGAAPGCLSFFSQRADGTAMGFSSQQPINDDKWHHLGVVRSSGWVTIYIDGVQSTRQLTTDYADFDENTGSLNIGGPTNNIVGVIDEVRVSNKVRTPQEFNLQLPPRSVSAVASGTSINLSWQNGGGAVGLLRYRIYRGADSSNVSLLDSTTSTVYSNTGLVAGTRYFYRVRAVDVTGFEGATSYSATAVAAAPVPTPIVSTGSATNIGSATATLSGTVNPNGLATTAFFEWGTSNTLASYNITSPQSIGSGLLAVDVQANLTDLIPNTAYYYCVVGQNSAGAKEGSILSFTTLMSGTLLGEYAPDANTVLLLHMNETSGLTSSDASSYGNNATATGTTIADGRFGKARRFNGISDFVNVMHSNSLNIQATDGFTAEAWVNFSESQREFAGIIAKAPASFTLSGYQIMIRENKPLGEIANETDTLSEWNGLLTSTALNDGKWHHVALTLDRVTKTGKMYLDGLFNTSGIAPLLTGVIGSTDNLVIGRERRGPVYFKGLIDEVRVSNKARSPQEFNLQLPPKNFSATLAGLAANLTWQTGGGGVPLMRYKIYRGTDSTNVVLIDSTTSLQFSNAGLSSGTTFFYRVSAVDSTGFEGAKSSASGVTTPVSPLAPIVTTGSITNIGLTTVTLNGTVNPNGVATTAYFEWGADTLSINQTPAQTIGSGTGLVSVSATVAGINPNSRFYYRLVAQNTAGKQKGALLSFVASAALTSLKAMHFSGPGDYVEIPHSDSLVPSRMTIELWFRINSVSMVLAHAHSIIDKRGGEPSNLGGYEIRLPDNNMPMNLALVFPSGASEKYIQLVSAFNLSRWYHIAVAHDGTNASVYVNGQLVVSQPIVLSTNSKEPITLGERPIYPLISTAYADIDEVRIWSYARTQSQIKDNMNKLLIGDESGLVGYWPFDDDIAATVTDRSRTANSGQRHGNAQLVVSDLLFAPSVRLATPANGAGTIPLLTTLTWNATPGVSRYRLEVSKSSFFTSYVLQDSGITAKSRQLGPLQDSTTYYWRVIATGYSGEQATSETWSFTTVPAYKSTMAINTSLGFAARNKAADYAPTEYKLFGLPGASDLALNSLLTGTQNVDWQAYWDNGAASNYLIPFDGSSNFKFSIGRGFWVISMRPISVDRSIASAPLNTDQEVVLPLRSGWNIVTNPFTAPIQWSKIQTVNGISASIFGFDSSFKASTTFQPYVGYYLFNGSPNPTLTGLRVPYNSIFTKMEQLAGASSKGWRLKVDVTTGVEVINGVEIGVEPDAKEGLDTYDERKPRGVGKTSEALLKREEWDKDYPAFASDIRPGINGVERWKMTVERGQNPGGRNQNVVIHVEGIESVPARYEVYLLDENGKRNQDLRKDPTYQFEAEEEKREFVVVVGESNLMRHDVEKNLPTEIKVGPNYPNPFNPETVIPIELPKSMVVKLVVYDILGRAVKTLYDGTMETGRHYVRWDGKDGDRLKVGTGVYLFRVDCGGTKSYVGKMLIIQ